MGEKLASLFTIIIAAGLTPLNAHGQQHPFKPYDIGVSAGVVLPGSIWVSMFHDNIITSASPMIKVSCDAYLVPKLAMGVYGSAVYATMDRLEEPEEHCAAADSILDRYRHATAYEIGGAIKPCFRAGDNLVFKPGLEFGYRRMSSDLEISYYYGFYESETVRFGDAHGLGLNGSLEVVMRTHGPVSPSLTLGMLSQPVGGSEDTEVSFAPVLYICGGVSF